MSIYLYNDPDEFVASLSNFEMEHLLNNVRRPQWKIEQATFGNIIIQFGDLGSGNICEGMTSDVAYFFLFPLTPSATYRLNGAELDANNFYVLGPNAHFCAGVNDKHEWCSVIVPKGEVEKRTLLYEGDNCRLFSEILKQPTSLVSDKFQIKQKLTNLIQGIFRELRIFKGLESSPAALTIKEKILDTLCDIKSRTSSGESNNIGRPKISRLDLINRVKELLNLKSNASNADLIYTPDMIAHELEVSKRTIQSTFREYYGVGFARYFKLHQIDRIHRILKVTDPDEKNCQDILADNGIWQQGHFAKEYRSFYGELPSETLRKPKGRIII